MDWTLRTDTQLGSLRHRVRRERERKIKDLFCFYVRLGSCPTLHTPVRTLVGTIEVPTRLHPKNFESISASPRTSTKGRHGEANVAWYIIRRRVRLKRTNLRVKRLSLNRSQ